MFLPEPVTLLVLGTLAVGDAYEGYKWNRPKDPEPPVHYVYDPSYFRLGDEDSCGDETNGPCRTPVRSVAAVKSGDDESFNSSVVAESKPCVSCKR